MAKRIQRRRVKGWRMPEGAIYVGRGSKYGNPYTVAEYGRERAIELYTAYLERMREHTPQLYKADMDALRGKDLACWCKEGDPCHADVLLELLAEQESSEVDDE